MSMPPPPGEADSGGVSTGRTNGVAIGALVCGLLALPLGLFFFPLGILLGLAAIVCGALGVRAANRPAGTGKGMAVWGIVTGVAGLLIGVAVLVFAVIVFSSLSDSGFFDDLPTSPEEVSEFQSEFQAELGQ